MAVAAGPSGLLPEHVLAAPTPSDGDGSTSQSDAYMAELLRESPRTKRRRISGDSSLGNSGENSHGADSSRQGSSKDHHIGAQSHERDLSRRISQSAPVSPRIRKAEAKGRSPRSRKLLLVDRDHSTRTANRSAPHLDAGEFWENQQKLQAFSAGSRKDGESGADHQGDQREYAGPVLNCSLGSDFGDTQPIGPETQKYTRSFAPPKRMRYREASSNTPGAPSRTIEESRDGAGKQQNENADPLPAGRDSLFSPTVAPRAGKIFAPESTDTPGHRPTQDHPASSSEVQRALVPADHQVPGGHRTRSNPSPVRQSAYQTAQSSPDPPIDSNVLMGNHVDGGPLQSTCPPHSFAAPKDSGGFSADVSQIQQSVDLGESNQPGSSAPRHLTKVRPMNPFAVPQSGSAQTGNGSDQPTSIRRGNDDEDDDFDLEPSETEARRKRFIYHPAANIRVSRSSVKDATQKQSVWDIQDEEEQADGRSSDERRGDRAQAEGNQTETPMFEPTALVRHSSDPVEDEEATPKASISLHAVPEAQLDQAMDLDLGFSSLPSLGSSLDPPLKTVTIQVHEPEDEVDELAEDDDMEEDSSVSRGHTTLLGIAGPESSQDGEIIDFQATQIESSESHPGGNTFGGTHIRGHLPALVSSPMTSPDRPLATSTAPTASPRRTTVTFAEQRPKVASVQVIPPDGIIPDSASPQAGSSTAAGSVTGARSVDSTAAAPSKATGQTVQAVDPSVIEETRFEDETSAEAGQPAPQVVSHAPTAAPIKRKPGRPRKAVIQVQSAFKPRSARLAARSASKPASEAKSRSSSRSRAKDLAPAGINEDDESNAVPIALTSRSEGASKGTTRPRPDANDHVPPVKGKKRRAESEAGETERDTGDTNYDEPPVAADRTTEMSTARKSPSKSLAVPMVVIPPLPASKRIRRMSAKATEAADASASSVRTGRHAKTSVKGKGRARQESEPAPTVNPSSPLTELSDIDGPNEATPQDRAPTPEPEFAVPALPASRLNKDAATELIGSLRVLAYWGADHCWYPGTMIGVGREGVKIGFDDSSTTILPLRGLRRCELRPGDKVVFTGAEDASEDQPPNGRHPPARKGSKLPFQPLKKVIRVEKGTTGVDAIGSLGRDDIVVVCGAEEDPQDPGAHKERFMVEAICIPSKSKKVDDERLADRELEQSAVRNLEEIIQAERLKMKKTTSVAPPVRRQVSASSPAPASTSVIKDDPKASRRKSLPMPAVPRKASKPRILPSGSPVKGGIQSQILKGYGFLVTFPPGHSATSKDAVASTIVRMGGTVVPDVNDLFVCDNYPASESEPESQSTVKIGFRDSELADLDAVLLLAPHAGKTFKYWMALALGIPCVSTGWLDECRDSGRAVDWTHLALGSGFSAVHDAYVNGLQSKLMKREKHDLESVAMRQHELRLMKDETFVCVCAKGSEGKEYGAQVRAILTAMGAKKVETTTNLASVASPRLASYDYILFRDLKSSRGKADQKAVSSLERGNGPTVVDFEWIKQCLIVGRKVEARMWSGDLVRAAEVEIDRANKLKKAAVGAT